MIQIRRFALALALALALCSAGDALAQRPTRPTRDTPRLLVVGLFDSVPDRLPAEIADSVRVAIRSKFAAHRLWVVPRSAILAELEVCDPGCMTTDTDARELGTLLRAETVIAVRAKDSAGVVVSRAMLWRANRAHDPAMLSVQSRSVRAAVRAITEWAMRDSLLSVGASAARRPAPR